MALSLTDPSSEQSQPLDAYGQPVTSQPGGGDMDLAASMNSNFTSRSADTEDTLSGGQPDDLASSHSSVAKQPNFEHYGISTKSVRIISIISTEFSKTRMVSPIIFRIVHHRLAPSVRVCFYPYSNCLFTKLILSFVDLMVQVSNRAQLVNNSH